MASTVPTVAARAPRGEIRSLTSLRFFAALVVFVHHIVNFVLLERYPGVAEDDLPFGLAALRQGHLGVTFFFVLSGFVLAYVYADSLRRLDFRGVGRFYVARVARIYPLHLATFLLFIPAALVGTSGGWDVLGVGAVANLLLVQAFVPLGGADGVATSFNGVAWSLSAELFFYLVFPFALFVLARVLGARRRPLLLVATGSWLAVLVGSAAFAGDSFALWFFGFFPVVHLASFVIGMCLGLRFVRRPAAALEAPTRAARWTMLELLAPAALVASCIGALALPLPMRYSAALLPATALVVWVFGIERGLVSRLLGARWLVYLGEISFGLYMVHLGVLVAASRAGLFGTVPVVPLALVLLAVSLAGAAASFHLLESPARGWLRRRGNGWVDELDVRLAREDAAGATTSVPDVAERDAAA